MRIASRVFSERGYSGVAIMDIAKEADVEVSVITNYFQNMDNLKYYVNKYLYYSNTPIGSKIV